METSAILDKTLELRLAPELGSLSAAEKIVVGNLLQVGDLFQRLYERSLHPQAPAARAALEERLDDPSPERSQEAADLLRLYRLFKGPVATTLENERVPFAGVDEPAPGGGLYPWRVTREEIELYLQRHPDERASLLALRSVVKRAAKGNLAADLTALDRTPALATLHPGLRETLEQKQRHANDGGAAGFYAVPYSVAFSEELTQAFDLLNEAAAFIADEDADFAAYLRHRARDLLSDDYEGGDAAWITGRFGRLNAQIGSYETYDDKLFGVKSFFGLSLLVKDATRSAELRETIGGLQALQDALPYEGERRVREDIPVGVYDIIADFGQARGINTASILPNESHISRKYGRTILLRSNVLTHERIFAQRKAEWDAALAPVHADDLDAHGNLYRTLWHEIGHYLGPDLDQRGRELDEALREDADLLEEMKSDLVSLFAAARLRAQGHFDDRWLRAFRASGIRRVLQKNRPRRQQPYQTMQLMQWNWFLDRGLLSFQDGVLHINYENYDDAVESLLAEVLRLQYQGDHTVAIQFIDRWTAWDDELHGVIAQRMREAESYRYALVRYGALGE